MQQSQSQPHHERVDIPRPHQATLDLPPRSARKDRHLHALFRWRYKDMIVPVEPLALPEQKYVGNQVYVPTLRRAFTLLLCCK